MSNFISDMIADSGNPFRKAALAVQEALKEDSGRRKKVDHWKGVARESLGKKRMSKKQWKKVLKAGYEGRLFRVDEDTLSYPILVVGEPGKPPAEAPSPEEDGSEDSGEPQATVPRLPSNPPADPPLHLPCGHWNRQRVPKPEKDCTATELRRKQNERGVPPMMTIKVDHPDDCLYCRMGKNPDYRAQQAGYQTPVPERMRRSKNRDESSGWSGLCTHPETHLYIGGLGNDCRRYHPGAERCVVHTTDKNLKETA